MTDLYPNLLNCQGCCGLENELMTPARNVRKFMRRIIPETFVIIIAIVETGFVFNFVGVFESARANSGH